MVTEMNKFSLNRLLSLVAPGSIIMLVIVCAVGWYYPVIPDMIKEYEAFTVFIFLLFAFIIGLLTDSVSQQAEYKAYKEEGKQPRMKVLEKYPHWLEDLDGFYFGYMGIHLYDWDHKTDKAKEGSFNGKKASNYNLSQFEHYANYVLAKESIYSKLESEKSTYLLCRNLSLAFRLCAVVTLVYGVVCIGFGFKIMSAGHIIQSPYFCIGVGVLSLALSFYLAYSYKKTRLDYTTQLYRYIRYYYLTAIKQNK